MKNIILLVMGVFLLSACGPNGGGSQSPSLGETLSDVEQFKTEFSIVNVELGGYDVDITLNGEPVSLDFNGDAPLNTAALDLTSDTTIKESLEPIIKDFEKNIEYMKANGASIALIDGDYGKLKGYYSLLFGLGKYNDIKPYTSFQIFDENQLIIVTEEACAELERAGVSILNFATEGILVLEKSCGVDYVTDMIGRDFILDHSASFGVQDSSNIKAFRYSVEGDDVHWFAIDYEDEIVIVDSYDYESLGEDLDISIIEDFNSRMVWGKRSIDEETIEGYLRYNGAKGSLKYTGGLPLYTRELTLDNQETLKTELSGYVKQFEENIATIKNQQGGSLFMEFSLLGSLDGYYSIVLALMEEVLFTDIITNIDLIYTDEQLIVLTSDTCSQLKKDNLFVILHSDTDEPKSIVLVHEDCNLILEKFTDSSGSTPNSIQYKESDLKYAYDYSISEGVVTLSDNLIN